MDEWSYNRYYYEKHKDSLKEKVLCECGSKIARYNLSHHHNSKKHLTYIKSTHTVEMEDLKKQLKEA